MMGVNQLNNYEHKLIRVKSIYYYMKRKNSEVNTHELADEFGYSTKTIVRDLRILEYNNLVVNIGRGKWLAG